MLDQEELDDEQNTLQRGSVFSKLHCSNFVTVFTHGPNPDLFSAWHLCFEGYTKYPTTTLTTWRTAHDLKRGIAGASGSGLINPGKKGDHPSQDLKRTATGVYGVQWVRDPKCDDVLMSLREENETARLSDNIQLLRRGLAKRRTGSGRVRQTSIIVAWRTGSHGLVNMGGLASPPR